MMAFTLRLSPSGISRTCCLTCLLLLLILLASFASASNVVKFTQNTKAADDEINDILEDEFLLIVDPESPQSTYKRPSSKATNMSSKSASSASSISSSASSSVSHTRKEQRPRTTTPVPSDLPGHTTHSMTMFDADFLREEFADDFLILSQDREMVERAEERRREEEEELARRVKRQVQSQNEGSGASSVDLELTTNVPWQNDFAVANSNARNSLEADAISQVQSVLQNTSSPPTQVIVDGARQGSTIISLTLNFDTTDVDKRELAVNLQVFRSIGFVFENTTYGVLSDPMFADTGVALLPAPCYLCAAYQNCLAEIPENVTWFCQSKSGGAVEFFNFGRNQGDMQMNKDFPMLSVEEEVEGGFPVNEELVTTVAVSMHGLISFGDIFNSRAPEPLTGSPFLVSAYWSNMQLISSDSRSTVWYHAYRKSGSNTAAELAMFRSGSEALRMHGNISNYDPTFMLVATFEEMPPFQSDPNTNERVNFQMMVITDGFSSYGMVIYSQGGMQWDRAFDRTVVIGYFDQNFEIDAATADNITGNLGLPGVWFLELGLLPDRDSNHGQECLNWYYQQLPMQSVYTQIGLFNLPWCPCNFRVAWFSWQWQIESARNGIICFLSVPFFGQFGKRCCYRFPWGVLLRNEPDAGTFLLYHPRRFPRLNYEQDTLPKQLCCSESDHCDLFYAVRPVGFCGSIFRFFFSLAAGDPHIRTLDGKTFPFNAIGEFILIHTTFPTGSSFELQGRTCQATSASGEPIPASVFCAFVAKSNSTIEVDLSYNKTSMLIYLDGQDVTLQFQEEGTNFRRSLSGLNVERVNDSIRASFDEGIALKFEVSNQLLLLETQVGYNTTTATTEGLFGNVNGNPEDDYVFPNNTVLPNDTSERELLAYGKTWAVTDQDRLFRNESGRGTAYYTNDTFQPLFLSDFSSDDRARAEATCGGPYSSCIFDYLATNDSSLALATQDAVVNVDENVEAASNSNPEVSGPARVEVTANMPVTFSLNATDPDDPSVPPTYVVVSEPEGLTFDNVTQIANFTPGTVLPSKFELFVEDSKGGRSPMLVVPIVFCSGCNSRGTCDFTKTRPSGSSRDYLLLAQCNCEPYYSGYDCENEFDGCALKPCPLGTTCTDLNITEHMAEGSNSTGYTCSDCLTGLTVNTVNNVPVCEDVNECTSGAANCSQSCTNTHGSFFCTCSPGYRLNSNDKATCEDIDECQENIDNCEQTCENDPGTFHCSCFDGYDLNATTGNTCVKNESVDPCSSSPRNCSYACVDNGGTSMCTCPKGYKLSADETSCEDEDECSKRQCAQVCNNTVGSYSCSCLPGYQLDADKTSCNACPPNRYGENCMMECDCRGQGTCNSIRGCQCNSGWSGSDCSIDIDECETNVDTCLANQICRNTQGSYRCDCPNGFRKSGTQCVDIDECATVAGNNCDQECTNTAGSYVCSCRAGYTAVSHACVDIDECERGISGCSQECINYPGSVNCACRQGFVLGDDRKTCIKEEDPCANLQNSCEYGCEVVNNAPQCYCQSGYELGVNSVCLDVDECSSNATNKCSQECRNTPGGYQCQCSKGYVLANDQRTCKVCDEYHWGDNCANTCGCSPLHSERCDPEAGCICKSGWLGTHCDEDRNECLSSPCASVPNSVCRNTPGAYQCECEPGYINNSPSSVVCEDVDECANNPCDQTCTNTVGSYRCSCATGFTVNGNKCVDIDECRQNLCEQKCRNTLGGYSCTCNEGFVLNATTRTTCYAKNACNANNTCEQSCVFDGSAETCVCMAGYTVDPSNSSACLDINECNEAPCQNGVCSNMDGTFLCSCSAGTYLLADGVTCAECPDGRYGDECSSNCTCLMDNTRSCNATDGTCICKDGWRGTDCEVDIDECAVNNTICDGIPNSICSNTNGSYICQCNSGFFSSGGQCLPCGNNHYGQECSQECSCIPANTQDCNDITGVCNCTRFWQGQNCSESVNLCTTANPCQVDQHETCRYIVGSYSCDCVSGYTRPSPSENCADVNECQHLDLNICDRTTEDCVNTDGSFYCTCKKGYANVTGTCQPTFINITNTITLNWTPTESLADPNTRYYFTLSATIRSILVAFYQGQLGVIFHDVVINSLRTGSVIVESQLQVDPAQGNDARNQAARAMQALRDQNNLTVDGQPAPITSFNVQGAELINSSGACNIFTTISSCNASEECQLASSGTPECVMTPTTPRMTSMTPTPSDDSLVIGLGVGIPLFFVVVLAIAFVVYLCVKRNRRKKLLEDNASDGFSSIFARQVPTKGNWSAARHPMYASENMSVDSDSSDDRFYLKGRQPGRSDFQDVAWQDRKQLNSPQPQRTDSAGSRPGQPPANFSWEYMFRLLAPYRDTGFEIQRPAVNPEPSPVHGAKRNVRTRDSLA